MVEAQESDGSLHEFSAGSDELAESMDDRRFGSLVSLRELCMYVCTYVCTYVSMMRSEDSGLSEAKYELELGLDEKMVGVLERSVA